MAIIKFKAEVSWSWRAVIERVEVERESESSVWIDGRRRSRVGYFDTWDLAHAALMHAREADVVAALRRLETAQYHLGNVKGMKPPAAAPSTQPEKD